MAGERGDVLMTARWFVVMLPGEYPETSDLFGPYRSEQRAEQVRDAWNKTHPDDRAHVVPIQPEGDMR